VQGNTFFYRDETFPGSFTVTGKTIAIMPDVSTNRIKITAHQGALTWTQEGIGTWKATRSTVSGVYDWRYVDKNNVPIPLEQKLTIADCQATPNTWYTDNVSVWVHTSDGLTPNDVNFIVALNLNQQSPKMINSTLYMENCDVVQGRTSNCFTPTGDPATSSGVFVGNKCTFIGGYVMKTGSITGNGFSGVDLKTTYLFNCISAYAGKDGFNHHFAGVANDITRRNYFVLECNGLSYNNGLNETISGSNNAYTCHEGVNVLRLGCVGYNTTGPLLADVNGCYSIVVLCDMKNSLYTKGDPSCVNYTFNDDVNPINVKGKILLVNVLTKNDLNSSYDLNIHTGMKNIYMYGNKLSRVVKEGEQPIYMN
jgi:hypothetical protein